MEPAESLNELRPPMSFPPAVFAKLLPDLYLERHLSLDPPLRPSSSTDGMSNGTEKPHLRSPHEFQPILIHTNALESSLGSAVVRDGRGLALCGIMGSIVDNDDLLLANSGSRSQARLFPNVQISVGRGGPPTNEEMTLSQTFFELVTMVRIIDPKTLLIPDTNKTFVLNAHIHILSRSGPPFSQAWAALIAALRTTRIPNTRIDDRTGAIICSATESKPLTLNANVSNHWASTLGAFNKRSTPESEENKQDGLSTILLAGPEAGVEEESCGGIINVVCAPEDPSKPPPHQYSYAFFSAGSSELGIKQVKRSLELSSRHASTQAQALVSRLEL